MADTVISRLVGLLNRSSLSPGEALVITHCRQIHMFFMKFPIDVLFVDRKHRVVGLVRNIKPNRFGPYFIKASYAIEALPGTIEATQTGIGDNVCIEDGNGEGSSLK